MTKWTVAGQRRVKTQTDETHAVWRGIGCLMGLIVPVICWELAVVTVKVAVASNWPLPYQLMGHPVMPALLWKSAALIPALVFIEGRQNLYAVLAVTFAYIIVASASISFAYALAYRFFGPGRYGPYDAPPPRVSVRRYKR
jgi:hypothetical protein